MFGLLKYNLLFLGALIPTLSYSAGCHQEFDGLNSNPYIKSANGEYLLHKEADLGSTCHINNLIQAGVVINPYIKGLNGRTLVDKLIDLEAIDELKALSGGMIKEDTIRYMDLLVAKKIKDMPVKNLYSGIVQDLMFSKFYSAARISLDREPSLLNELDTDGFTVGQALVASLESDNLDVVRNFDDVDFSRFSEKMGMTPIQMACKWDYIKVITYLMANGTDPFQENLYGSDTVDTINTNKTSYCSALIKTIIYEIKDKE